MQEIILTTKSIEVTLPNGSHLTVPRGAFLVYDLVQGMASYRELWFSLRPDEYVWPHGGPSKRHTLH